MINIRANKNTGLLSRAWASFRWGRRGKDEYKSIKRWKRIIRGKELEKK